MNNLLAKLGLTILLVFIALCVFAPQLTSWSPNQADLHNVLSPPGHHHLLGTDELGRDIFSRMLYGGRVSLAVGFIAIVIALLLGTAIGAISGFYGGKSDRLIMHGVDFFLALPTIFLILTVQIMLKPNIINVMIIIGLTSWMGTTRLVRAEFLKLKNFTYIRAARAYGHSTANIIFKKILPNAVGPLLVSATLGMAGAILTESVLSYLGLGVQPPFASWGNMLQNGQEYLTDAPWVVLTPGLAIFITVLGLNFIGEAIRARINNEE